MSICMPGNSGLSFRRAEKSIDCYFSLAEHAAMDMQSIVAACGTRYRMASICGTTKTAPYSWVKVPAKYVKAVSKHTGIPKHIIRPDLFDEIEAHTPSEELKATEQTVNHAARMLPMQGAHI